MASERDVAWAASGAGQANVADVITRHANERPYAVAIVEGNAAIHCRTLDALIWRAAWHFRRSGIAPGDMVGLAMPHSALCLVAVYALARIGAVGTSLPLSEPAAQRATVAERLGVKFVVGAQADAGPGAVPTVLLTPEVLKAAPGTLPAGLRADGGDRPWTVWRTSGTTSEAKAVAVSHRASLASYQAQAGYFAGPDDRFLAVLDIGLVYGLTWCNRTLFGGGTVVIQALPMRQGQILDFIDRFAITRIGLTPNYLASLLEVLPADACRCPSLKEVTVTGMAMPESLRSEIRRRFNRNLSVRYGSNEAQTLTAADADMQEKYPETVGAVLPGVELEIVDDEGRKLPAGEAGHVRARTPWMPSGYLDAPPEIERRTFRDGWIHPGDIGVLNEDGMLFIKGRADDMINFDGIKIMPADIEAALLSHPAVAEAVAFPVPSRRHHHLPVAAVVLRAPAGADELRAHCVARLGLRAPRRIAIEQSFPRNAMGKVLRTELAERLARRYPER